MDFANGNLWQHIVQNNINTLKRLDLDGLRIWLGNHADSDDRHQRLIQQVTVSFGSTHPFWGKQWSVHQTHKLRPNHLNLTVNAQAF
jgi:hypothetical protein